MTDIREISDGLQLSNEGIWYAGRLEAVSYPQGGHADCFQVEDGSFWFQHRNDCIAAMIRHHPPPSGVFLDIGGGNGFVAQRLQAEGMEVVLIEPGPTGASNARIGRRLANVVCATIDDARFKPGSFSAIGMFDVIEHIGDDRGFLRAATRLIPVGGMAYFTVPCHSWLWSRADIISGHHRRHTFASLRALMGTQYDIAYMSYYFRPLLMPQLLLRAMPYRLGFRRRKGMLAAESEHGTAGGTAVRALSHLLARETANVGAGRSMRIGASALVAARRRS